MLKKFYNSVLMHNFYSVSMYETNLVFLER